jgi:putative ABC transport system permease protein
MTAAVRERPPPTTGSGGAPARRAMARWAWRLFRREWRQQALVLALLVVAIAATTLGLGVASNSSNLKADPTFGTANTVITLPGDDPSLASDIAAVQSRVGTVEVIAHQHIPVPGSVSSIDLRAEDPNGPYGHVTLRLDSGRLPSGPGEVAVTGTVAKTLAVQVGNAWNEGGRMLQVVGVVENPLNLLDQFALVAPGQADPPADVSILVNASQQALQSFNLPSGTGLVTGSRGASPKVAVETLVLVLGTLGLLFVGLLAVAGFTVMAQRRLRALGMLGSIGATDGHVRLVMLANGAAVGATAAIVGTAVGLAGWFAFVPTLRSISEHRVDPFALPWWAIATAMVLTFVTAVAAAWWPARAVARVSVVGALSGRPPRPQPAHRFASLGGVLLGAGIVLLAFADQRRVGFIIGGTVATVFGLLFLAPLAIRALAGAGRRSPISIRLALRDLARYQARSGAALGAVTLAIGIAATIAISASAAQTPPAAGNLPTNQLMLYLTPTAGGGYGVPLLSAAQQQTVTNDIAQLAAAIHATAVLPLDQAYNPQTTPQADQPGQPPGYTTPTLAKVTIRSQGEEISSPITLYAATPAVLDHYGIEAGQIDPTSDIIASRSDLGGRQIFDPIGQAGPPGGAAGAAQPTAGRAPGLPKGPEGITHPTIQTVTQLPIYTSEPGTLITNHGMQTLGLQPVPAAWLIQTSNPLTAAQIHTAQKAAAGAGLYVETRAVQKSLAPLRNGSTAAGILLALGVLGMTVGLIRSETASDLRTLTAAGASSSARRTLTAATAGALALLGAVVGIAGAYAALLAWHRSDLSPLGRIPVLNLTVILVGLPAIAFVAGWLLAGREPAAIARRPLE